ncbi:hypothetical protein GBAR_LOCUS7326 [Geodia barretti]|uniref:Uncharacterized protein n=1 Tax=Geodia barretti TaxID=519541 RepID=A0AA35RH17_GEOBA|nr:hypothetical protein GBAR_LOCUS7326 [Geodia barretti]
MITLPAPPLSMCAAAFAASVNRPVHSTTIHAHLGPRNISRFGFLKHADGLAVDNEIPGLRTNRAGIGPVCTVVSPVVKPSTVSVPTIHGDQVEPVVIRGRERRTGYQPPNTTEAIDTNTRHHLGVPPVNRV